MSAKTLEGPALYSSAQAPHQRKPQEAFTDPTVQTVVLLMASQIGGKTEIFNNVLGYHMHWQPRSCVMMYPQLDAAQKYSKKKFMPMVEATPALRDLVRPARSRDSGNTILVKEFRGGSIFFVGANSPASLRGASGAVLLGDEIDSNKDAAGDEGDAVELLFKRGESFPGVVQGLGSTPTVRGVSKIWAWWELSDQQFWFVPCPKCGGWQALYWRQVTWPKGEPEKAELLCSSCQAALNDGQRLEMYYAGQWRATAPFKGIAGFHLNWLYCPWPAKKGFAGRLHQMAVEFERASKAGERKLQVLVNTAFVELWDQSAETVDHRPLLERAENYTPDRLPDGVLDIRASVDVQKDRLECETIGLGLEDETWGIEYRKFYGDTDQGDVWQELATHLGRVYVREDLARLPITATAIDMRHRPNRVRDFCQKAGIPRVYAVYGVGQPQSPVFVTSHFNKHYRLRTFAVNGKVAKDMIFARLKVEEPGPRYCHFPRGQGYTEEFFLQLASSERLIQKKVRGVLVEAYEKVRERNEALDIRVYFLAQIDILRPALNAIARKLKAQEGVIQERKDYPAGTGGEPNLTQRRKDAKTQGDGPARPVRKRIQAGGQGGGWNSGPGGGWSFK